MLAGYSRHGLIIPGLIAFIGLLLIGTGALAGFRIVVETSVTVMGSLTLAAAHLWNLRASRASAQPAGAGLRQ